MSTHALSALAVRARPAGRRGARHGSGRHPLQADAGRGRAFLRLDTQTGAISICQRKDGRWACEAVPDDRRALETEIDRLATENSELKGAVRRLEELLALPDPEPGRTTSAAAKFRLPSEEDVDRAMDYVQRMMRKFKDADARVKRQGPAGF